MQTETHAMKLVVGVDRLHDPAPCTAGAGGAAAPLHAVCGQMDPLHRHPLSDVRLQPDDKCDPENGA